MSLIRPADCIGCQLWASGHKERFTETKRARGQPLWTNTNTASPGRTAACRQKKYAAVNQRLSLSAWTGSSVHKKPQSNTAISIPKGDSDRAERELQQPRIVLCMKGHRNKKPQQEAALSNFHLLFQICLCFTSCECQQWAVVGCEDQYYFTHK